MSLTSLTKTGGSTDPLEYKLSRIGGASRVGYTSTKNVNDALISLDVSTAQTSADLLALQGSVSHLEDMLTLAPSMSPSTSVNQPSAGWMNGRRGTVILGDSISHGAFAGNLYSNGIVRLLARAMNGKHGTDSYGFVPISALGIGQPYESRDIHSPSVSGFAARESNLATDCLNGLAFRSLATGSKITVNLPSFQRRCIVHHVNQAGGGSFTIKVNGFVMATVNTSSTNDISATTSVVTDDNGRGSCTIEVETTNSSVVDILGFSYVSASPEHTLQNMSQSGRRARWLSSAVIDTAFRDAGTVIFALGYNDHAETDQSYQAAVIAHIDTAIAKANQYGTAVVVPDYIWTAGPTNWMRVQLKRLAEETGGIYIPFAEYLKKPDGTYADSAHLVNTLGMWVDGAHPNADGCSWVFGVLARAMGLPCTSKRQALEQFDWWMPLTLGATVVVNSLATFPSAVKRTPSGLSVRFFIKRAGSGVIPVGTYDIAAAYPLRSDIFGGLSAFSTLIEDSATGVVGNVRIGASGGVRVRITTLPTVGTISAVVSA